MLQEDLSAGQSAAAAGIGMGMMIFMLLVAVVLIAAMWKVFEKAGEPGWAALIPIYNFIVLLKIAGKPAWWIVLMLIPFVNFVIAIVLSLAIAKNFGKGAGFGLGLAFLGPVFYPLLAWGDSRYQGQTS
ncbi:MAG TPA: DUF5684 domain-containing protein [Thermoanaerobaculia bacterium]|nr:DUF5684 domain-containing protein [Thermoanaerobaculia bacterium]